MASDTICSWLTSPAAPPATPPQLAADTPWAPAGHEVQTVQLELPALGAAASSRRQQQEQQQGAAPPATAEEDAEGVTVRSGSGAGDGWALRFDRASGSLCSWQAGGGQELLAAPLAPCFYRAPTDNDKGGSGGSSYAARWKAAGLDRLQVAPGSASISCAPCPEDSSSLQVRCAFQLQPGERAQEDAAAELEEGVGVGEVRLVFSWLRLGSACRAAAEQFPFSSPAFTPALARPTRPSRRWAAPTGCQRPSPLKSMWRRRQRRAAAPPRAASPARSHTQVGGAENRC